MCGCEKVYVLVGRQGFRWWLHRQGYSSTCCLMKRGIVDARERKRRGPSGCFLLLDRGMNQAEMAIIVVFNGQLERISGWSAGEW